MKISEPHPKSNTGDQYVSSSSLSQSPDGLYVPLSLRESVLDFIKHKERFRGDSYKEYKKAV